MKWLKKFTIRMFIIVVLYTGYTDWLQPKQPHLPSIPKLSTLLSGWTNGFSKPDSTDNSAGKTTVYKWKDENGKWVYSTHKQQQTQTETVTVDHQTNVLAPTQPVNQVRQQPIDGIPKTQLDNPYRDIPKLIEDANNIDKLMRDRTQRLNEIID
jgi:hypothetical protein